uniref:Uncharacterized protein n=1 Tax=Lactuca sativa TaxID=4236 RepID=A0A9R1WB00_LACSA|nr:hypothetical protein LSAT_V11C200066330 [Lactuca sativa]
MDSLFKHKLFNHDKPNTKHLEKQNELLMDAYRSMSHALHKLQFNVIISALRSVGNIVTSDDHQTQVGFYNNAINKIVDAILLIDKNERTPKVIVFVYPNPRNAGLLV